MPEMTRRSFLATSAAVGLAPAARAESSQEKGKRLVHAALDALGGESFLAVRNQITTGRAYSFYRARVQGLARVTIYDRYSKMQPNADADWLPVSRKEIYTEKGDYYALFLHGEAWEITFQGARPYPLDLLARYRLSVRRDFLYFLRYRLREEGLYYYYTGLEIVDNIPTDAVEVTDAEGESITVYLRQADGLPHMSRYLRRDPKTRIPFEEKTIWAKFRPHSSGAMLPWNVRRERDGEKVYEQFAASVEVNQDIPEKVFQLPGGIKLLDPDG